jgi:hypothetical protein
MLLGLGATILGMSGCAGGGKPAPLLELHPPARVDVKPLSRAVEVRWSPSPDEAAGAVEGYAVYAAPRSLSLLPKDRLPEPIRVKADTHRVVVRNLEPGRPVFVHVRTIGRGGRVSAPSIPEKVAVPTP